jgi:hypothetical protein
MFAVAPVKTLQISMITAMLTNFALASGYVPTLGWLGRTHHRRPFPHRDELM